VPFGHPTKVVYATAYVNYRQTDGAIAFFGWRFRNDTPGRHRSRRCFDADRDSSNSGTTLEGLNRLIE
jgi:hypothetical protein